MSGFRIFKFILIIIPLLLSSCQAAFRIDPGCQCYSNPDTYGIDPISNCYSEPDPNPNGHGQPAASHGHPNHHPNC